MAMSIENFIKKAYKNNNITYTETDGHWDDEFLDVPYHTGSVYIKRKDALIKHLDKVFPVGPSGKIKATEEDVEKILDSLPNYFDNKDVEIVETYTIEDMFGDVSQRITGYLAGGNLAFGSFIPPVTTSVSHRARVKDLGNGKVEVDFD